MRKSLTFQAVAVAMTVLVSFVGIPANAQTVVNNTNAGTIGAPVAGDGLTGVDTSNNITNNANIYYTGRAIYSDQGTIKNNGIAYSSGDSVVSFGAGNNKLTNAGTLQAADAVNAIFMGSGNSRVTNSGTITINYASSNGIQTCAGDDNFTNSGTVNIDGVDYHGIQFGSGDDTFNNSGMVYMDSIGHQGIRMGGGGDWGDDTLINSGTITINTAANVGINLEHGNDLLENTATGVIAIGSTESCDGIKFGSDGEGNNKLMNAGTINLGTISNTGIVFGSDTDYLRNSGLITMASVGCSGIQMHEGDDTLDNTGGTIIISTADNTGIGLGSGDDTLINASTISIGSASNAGINTGSGTDKLTNKGIITIGTAGCAIKMGTGTNTFNNSGTVTITSTTSGNGIDLDGGPWHPQTLINSGTIAMGTIDDDGIEMGNGSDYIRNKGLITMSSVGDDGSGNGIQMKGGNDTLDNTGGTIIIGSASGGGIGLGRGTDTLINASTISIGSARNKGIGTGTGTDVITNEGLIAIGTTGDDAIEMGSGTNTLNNTGVITINSTDDGGSGIDLDGGPWHVQTLINAGTIAMGTIDSDGIEMGSGSDYLRNRGLITMNTVGDNGNGVGIQMMNGDDTLDNTGGTIIIGLATGGGIGMGHGNDTLINASTIDIGTVVNNDWSHRSGQGIGMGNGTDVLRNRGLIQIGTASRGIAMQDGDDTLDNTGGTIIIGLATGPSGISMGSGTDILINASTIAIGTASGRGIAMGRHDDTITNDGLISIASARYTGVQMQSGNDTIHNKKGGVIAIGTVDTNTPDERGTGIGMGNGTDLLLNEGTISISYGRGSAINFGRGTDTLTNKGLINITSSDQHGIAFGSDDDGDGAGDLLTNTGTMTIGTVASHGIAMMSGDDTFNNDGTVNIARVGRSGIHMGEGNDTLINTSMTSINVTAALVSGIMLHDGNDVFQNSGLVNIQSAFLWGIQAGLGDDTIENDGIINIGSVMGSGAIAMAAGADTMINRGIINVTTVGGAGISMGAGNDILENWGAINVPDADSDRGISMWTGDDTFICAGALNMSTVDGGTGTDELDFDGSKTLTFNGDFRNWENMNKNGSGTWNLGGEVDASSMSNVNQGTININGTLTSPTVMVNGGVLGGTGNILGNVTNNAGAVGPGASVGTLTITGNYVQNPGSTLDVEIQGAAADLLDITGTATLNGGKVKVIPLGTIIDGTYLILQSTGLTGVFDGVTSTALLQAVLDYLTVPDSVLLTVSQKSIASVVGGAQGPLAGALDGSGGAGGPLGDFLRHIRGLGSAGDVDGALRQLNPNVYSHLGHISMGGMRLYMGTLLNRINSIRRAAMYQGTMTADVSSKLTGHGPVLADASVPQATGDYQWAMWGDYFGQLGDQDSKDGVAGYDYWAMGPALGIDAIISDELTIGASIGYAYTNVDTKTVTATTDINSLYTALYAAFTPIEQIFVDASVGYSHNWYDTSRDVVAIGTIESDHVGDDLSVYLGGGYQFEMDKMLVTIPTASLQYTHHWEDDFTETVGGASFMKVSGLDQDSLVSLLGARLDYMFDVSDDTVILAGAGAAWGHEYLDTQYNAVGQFSQSSSGSFTTPGLKADRDSALFNAGLSIFPGSQWEVSFDYDFDLRSSFMAHNFAGKARYKF